MTMNLNNHEVTGGAIQTSSLTQLQVSSTPIGSVTYGKSFSVQIYRKANQCTPNGNQETGELFYHSPLSVLDIESIQNKYNPFQKQYPHQVTFNIDMWNEDIQKKVTEKMKEFFPNSAHIQVQIVPCEKVWLTCSMDMDGCWLDDESQSPPYDLTKSITFTVLCSSKVRAREVAQIMRESPVEFAKSLRLFICLPSIETKKTQTRFTFESASSAKLSSQLLQRYPLDVSHVLMSDDETKRMLDEMTNYSVQTYDEIGEAGNQEKGFDAFQILKEMLIDRRETIKRGADVAWDSVFWMDENSRPDRVCHQVNDLHKKISSKEWDKIAADFQKEKESKKTEGLERSSTEFAEFQTNSKKSSENSAKNNRLDDNSEKNSSSNKSTKDSKVNREIGADIKVLSYKIGNAKGSYGRDENQNQENDNSVETTKIRHHDDAYAHRDVNNLKEALKVDEADSFSSRSSNANKELASSCENIQKVRKQLEDNKSHIEWDGEKFVPKEMQLNRINLTKIRSRQIFEDLRTRASRTVTSICMTVKILDQRNLEMKTKMLQEEKEAKEVEVDNNNKIIQAKEIEIEQLKRQLMEVDKKNAEIRREQEIEIENLKREKLKRMANESAETHAILGELLKPIFKQDLFSPTHQEKATLFEDLFKRIYFRFCDKDGSGFISPSELRDAMNFLSELTGDKPMEKDEVVESFLEIDTDGDGEISFEEFAKIVAFN